MQSTAITRGYARRGLRSSRASGGRCDLANADRLRRSGFQKQIDTLQERHEQREDAMRARYDTVIADLNRHRDSMSSEMTAALTRSADKLEDLENQIREMRIALK